MVNIIGHKKIFLSISGFLVLCSIAAVVVFGLKPGIDFTGGVLWNVSFSDTSVTPDMVSSFLVDQGIQEEVVQKELTSDSFLIRMPLTSEQDHQTYKNALKERFGSFDELRFESIGPTIGAQLKSKSIEAAIFVLLAISLYIAFSFRKVSYPVKSWKYGIITLGTLFHDVMIPVGVLAVLGHFLGIEIDTNFIVALLVIMGFSVHDTIVVFDRIRENVLSLGGKSSFSETVNVSVNQTIARSINTSFTLVLVLAAMLIVGATSLKLFVLIMLIGTVMGTYSSIFIASPLLTFWSKAGKN